MDFKLDPEKKAKWLKALRSGRYTQGRAKLRKKVSKGKYEYCCLGVYANVCGVDWKPIFNYFGEQIEAYTVDLEYKGSWTVPDGQYIPFEMIPLQIQRVLSSKNDTYKWSFKQIADWIEEKL